MESSQEFEFLQKGIGEVLSKGISETIINKPSDPIEYLGLWLLHYSNKEDRIKIRKKQNEELEKTVKEESSKVENLFDKSATAIQQQYRKYLIKKKEREKIVMEQKQKFSDELAAFKMPSDEEVEEDMEKVGEMEEDVALAEKERRKMEKKMELLSKLYNEMQSEESRESFRRYIRRYKKKAPSKEVFNVLKCCALLQNTYEIKYMYLKTWNVIATISTQENFFEIVRDWDVNGTHRKTKFKRINRILRKYLIPKEEEIMKKERYEIFVLYNWLKYNMEMRKIVIKERIVKKIKTEYLEEFEDDGLTQSELEDNDAVDDEDELVEEKKEEEEEKEGEEKKGEKEEEGEGEQDDETESEEET